MREEELDNAVNDEVEMVLLRRKAVDMLEQFGWFLVKWIAFTIVVGWICHACVMHGKACMSCGRSATQHVFVGDDDYFYCDKCLRRRLE